MPLDKDRKDDLEKHINHGYGCMQRVMETPDGKDMLDFLGETFFERETTIVPGDINATLTRCGAREVILYIRENTK